MHAFKVYMVYYHRINPQRVTGTKVEKPLCMSVRRSKTNSAHDKINKNKNIEIFKRTYKKYVRDIEDGRKRLKML